MWFKKIGFLLFLISFLPFTLYGLTLEEKVGQLLFVHFHGRKVNEDAKILVQDAKVGGIVLYNWSNGLEYPRQIKTLTAGLQALTQENPNPIPLFIAIDEEGGGVSRLHCGFSQFPNNYTIGTSKSPLFAKSSALTRGKEMLAVGINLNFAPVVDIACNPKHAVMKARSFGNTPETVVAFAEKALEGYQEAGLIAVLKHYPGHGDVNADSHSYLPCLNKSLQELEQMEFVPYQRLKDSAEMIMTGHLFVPSLDDETCATLSKKVLDYLKQTIGFEGVIISDSLVMEGILQKCSTVDEAAIEALKAGCDLLLLGGKALSPTKGITELTSSDVLAIRASIVQAVLSGYLSEEQIDASLSKVLKLKEKYLKT